MSLESIQSKGQSPGQSLGQSLGQSNDGSVKFTLLLANILSLTGCLVAVFLTHHFYEVRNGTAAFKSYCNIAGKMNCDVVAASSFAELFRGLPISSVAAGWYLAFFIITLIAH